MSKFVCPDCHKIISKCNSRRHKTRCGITAHPRVTSIHSGRVNPRFRMKRNFDENGLRILT